MAKVAIYRINNDGFRYQELDLEVNEFLENFPEEFSYKDCHGFDRLNLTLLSFWPSMKTDLLKIQGSENLVPEVVLWRETCLALSPTAYRYTFDALKSYGEFLPILVGDAQWYVFNCTSVVNVDGEKTNENTIVFDGYSVSNKLIFKCLYTHGVGLYCTEKFKEIIEQYGLVGIGFETRRRLLFDEFEQVFLQC